MSEKSRETRVALVGPEVEENLGLRYLASSLAAAGFESEILPFNASAELPRVLEAVCGADEPPLVVAISLAFQWRALDCLGLATALREKGFRGHVTGGGHFGTFRAEEILREIPEIDSICRHEAEETLVDLARAVKGGRALDGIPGLVTRGEGGTVRLGEPRQAPDLARLPWPDRRGEPSSCLGHRIAAMVSGRGCYASCAFCCIAAWHEAASPGKRFRLRPVENVADEMAWLSRERTIDVFVFHDDNFFLPRPEASLARIHALADALEARRIGRFATVVKARPPDVTPEVFGAMRDRLGLARVFLGVETDAHQGLATLGRGVRREENGVAMRVLADLGIYVCFNMLIFDPDTTPASLEVNLAFMEDHGDSPFNFGRVELYAGTPLLARMLGEGRARGDWLGHDYELASPEVQRVFDLAMRCFFARNFAEGGLANRLMGTRFDVETCRHFHPDLFRPDWLDEAKALSRALAFDSVQGLREILRFVERRPSPSPEGTFVRELSGRLRAAEKGLRARAEALEEAVQQAVGVRCSHALCGCESRTPERGRRGVEPSKAIQEARP